MKIADLDSERYEREIRIIWLVQSMALIILLSGSLFQFKLVNLTRTNIKFSIFFI